MSKRSQEKRRARAKEKKLAKRRMLGSSPLARLAGDSAEACECWTTYAQEDNRMRSMSVFRAVRGGGHVAAFFLIDYDCIGLKDAFYKLDANVMEVRERMRERTAMEGIRFARITIEEARQRVAGAIKWTRAHPCFQMPPQLERTVKILGGVGDIEGADAGEFGTEEGGLFYVGREVDLKRRLVGMTVEEFIRREDVDYVFHMGDETFRDAEEFEEEWEEDDLGRPVSEAEYQENEEAAAVLLAMHELMKKKMIEGVRRWCFANAQMPHPYLEKAIDLVMTASSEGMLEDDEKAAEEKADAAGRALASLETEADLDQMEIAERQVRAFMKSLGSEAEATKVLAVSSEELDAITKHQQ